MSNLTPFEQLKSTVDSTSIEYAQVTFPISHLGEGVFRFSNGFEAKFTTLGAGYLSERLPQYKYRWFTRHANDGDWDAIERTVNQHPHQLMGNYVAALYEGEIVGIMSHYNAVPHNQLLEYIKAAGLENDVTSHWITQMELVINITVKSQCHDGFLVAMRIVNGHSGHSALRYRSVILAEGYEWEDRVSGSARRHLSQVGQAISSMREAMETITELKVDDRLMNMTAEEALEIAQNSNKNLSVRQERLLMAAKEAKCQTALEVVVLLGGYAATSGYKSSVTRLLDPVIDRALGRI